jgi:hypothetical protein
MSQQLTPLKLVAKVVFCEAFQSSRRKYRGTCMNKTVSKPLAHLIFLSGVNCYDIGSIVHSHRKKKELCSTQQLDVEKRYLTRGKLVFVTENQGI